MFNGSPIFVRVRRYSRQVTDMAGGQGWWLVMGPGLALIFLGLAILVWPELLAYMVALALLTGGMVLALWGWRMRGAERRLRRRRNGRAVYYEEPLEPGSRF